MDRPLGPRDPKRTAAYESIFGRPNPTPHRQLAPPTSYPPPFLPQQVAQPYPYPNNQYQIPTDRRTSYAPSFAPSVHSQASYLAQGPSNYRQSPYPSTSPQPQLPQGYSSHVQPSYGYPASIGPPQSIASNPHSPGVIAPQPEEPPDASLEPFTQSGLTPAQAYQAQVYLNSPAAQQADWNRFNGSPVPPDRLSYSQSSNGLRARTPEPPRIPLSLQQDEGRLGIDFGERESNNSSEQGTDEGSSSELPWARKERTCAFFCLYLLQHVIDVRHNHLHVQLVWDSLRRNPYIFTRQPLARPTNQTTNLSPLKSTPRP